MTGLDEKSQCFADINNIVDAPLLQFCIQNRRENMYKDIWIFLEIFQFCVETPGYGRGET